MHSLVLEDDMTDQDVAKEREDDDEGVRHDEQGFHRGVLGLGPVAPPAHKVLPVREGVVVPEEVRGVGRAQGGRQAPLVLLTLGALRGSHQGQEDEQHPVRDHIAGATAPGTVLSGRPRRAAGGRARGGCAGCTGRDPWASQRPGWAPARRRPPASDPHARGSCPTFLCLRPRLERAPPPIGQRGVSGGDGDAPQLGRLRGCCSAAAPPPPARSHPRTETPAGRPRRAPLLGSAQVSFLKREQGAALRES